MNTKGHISNPNEKEKEKRDSIPKRSRISLKSHLPAIPCICTFISFGKHEPVLGFPYGFVCIFETFFSSSSFASCKNASTAVNHSGDCALSATERTVFSSETSSASEKEEHEERTKKTKKKKNAETVDDDDGFILVIVSLFACLFFEVTNKKWNKKCMAKRV
jgi:hypothetical protein